ncbi:MAG: MarR family transcriptional regulator [Mariprofundaceae bacterium]|nr:MarR family transcriptional regulator [Mariprofundaceae bacterium]
MVDYNYIDDTRMKALNRALEAMHFGFRAIIAGPDEHLKSLGLSRVHHRILYFIGRNSGCSITELLRLLRVTKQYINKPLRQLTERGYVVVARDAGDKRIKRLSLSDAGIRLEERLSGAQRAQLARVFGKAGPEAEQGWRKVMDILAKSTFH